MPPHVDPNVSCHTVFGNVIEGLFAVKNIRKRNPETDTEPGDAIKTVRITESQ